MRIALDAMGSDNCPVPDVAGAVLAAREFGDTILLVGDAARIQTELAKQQTTGLKLEVIPASDAITMEDKPSIVGKAKPNSSMHVGMNLVKEGKADAFVTAGNTGAALSIATLFTLRRIPGVKRPALSAIVAVGKSAVILLDVGANADSKAEWLGQFALMGRIYARNSLKLDNPKVALLSNGEEEGKGNQLIHEASALLQTLPVNFVGNIEPKDLLKGEADVVVSDGFVGNILLKSLEAATRTMGNMIRDEIMHDTISKVGGLLAQGAFRRVYKQVDPFEVGGAPLLGVNGVVIIGHGRSNDKAIKNAIGQARKAVSGRVIESIEAGLKELEETERR
ncbi:MAG TPA: phosphate acyltransferase PlsX [Phototrophicaceae bacterium]|nr:phosphate acyltransferase PlsX [Phototrophicaceae bacterium]